MRHLGSERHSPVQWWSLGGEGGSLSREQRGRALVGSCGDRPKRTEPIHVTRVCGRTEERDARRCQPEPSRSRAASELVHWSRERVGSPRAAAELHVASSLPGSGHIETAAHPHRCHTHLPLSSCPRTPARLARSFWSGKGFTAGSYCPHTGVRGGSMSALPALTVLKAALLRSASEWSDSLHPDLIFSTSGDRPRRAAGGPNVP